MDSLYKEMTLHLYIILCNDKKRLIDLQLDSVMQ